MESEIFDWYCAKCGTTYHRLNPPAIEAINTMLLTNEAITLQQTLWGTPEKKYWSNSYCLLGTYPPGYSNSQDDREALKDVCDCEHSHEFVSSSEIRIKETYSLKPQFIQSRTKIDRTEIILHKDKYGKEGLCPLCGSELYIKYTNGYIPLTNKSKLYSQVISDEKKQCRHDASDFVMNAELSEKLQINRTDSESIDIKKILLHLINIESDIILLEKHLENLLIFQKESNRKVIKAECWSDYIKNEVKEQIKKCEMKLDSLNDDYKFISLDVSTEDFGITQPSLPVLENPGIFNRKRVEEENKNRLEIYDQNLADYKSKLLSLRTEEIEKRKAQNDEISHKRDAARNSLLSKIEELRNNLSAQSTLDLIGLNVSVNNFYLEEIKEVKERIVELCKVRAKLHSLGFIYPKYLDFPALTTMYEYFETGRCSILTGPDGAYNLYENEIRTNRIIAQLDQVIDNLESIKTNQYMMYQELSAINFTASSISSKMSKAIEHLSQISENTLAIKDNTEMIAYNTEKTAQYTKINAELTDALGYIVALK